MPTSRDRADLPRIPPSHGRSRPYALLLAEGDVEEIGKALEPGSSAAVLVYESTWAGPFGSAVRRAGGQLVANERIPT